MKKFSILGAAALLTIAAIANPTPSLAGPPPPVTVIHECPDVCDPIAGGGGSGGPAVAWKNVKTPAGLEYCYLA